MEHNKLQKVLYKIGRFEADSHSTGYGWSQEGSITFKGRDGFWSNGVKVNTDYGLTVVLYQLSIWGKTNYEDYIIDALEMLMKYKRYFPKEITNYDKGIINKYIKGVEQYTDGDSKLIYDKKIGRLTAICKDYLYGFDLTEDTTISFEYYEPIEEALARLNTESPDALTNKKCREQLYEIYANEEWKRNYSRG